MALGGLLQVLVRRNERQRPGGVMLSVLKGKRIKEITTENEYLGISFDDGNAGLSIFNNYSMDAADLQDLVGRNIEDVSETPDSIRIKFDSGHCLEIGMRECDYNGPESLIYSTSSECYAAVYDPARYCQFRP